MISQTFTITEDHLKLLRRAYVRWDDMEFGAPCIDPKRPYGNSDVTLDVAQIIGDEIPERDGARSDWLEDNYDRLRQIHCETQTVLQIALSTGEFRAGTYVLSDYRTWTLVP